MSPNAVLSEDQKRIRFQRMMQRRNAELLSINHEHFSRLQKQPDARGQTYCSSLMTSSISTEPQNTTAELLHQNIQETTKGCKTQPVQQLPNPGKRPYRGNTMLCDQPPLKIRLKKPPKSGDFLVEMGPSDRKTSCSNQQLSYLIEQKLTFISQTFYNSMVSFGLDQSHGLCFNQVTRYAMAFHKFAHSLG